MVDAFFAVFQRPNFLTFVIIFLWGFYVMITRYNLVKKLIGMYLVQTSVIFFLVSISAKKGATVPVLLSTTDPVQAASYVNPLPHVLTLTAIVVGVAATVQVLFLAFILVVLGAGDWGTAMAKLLAGNL